MKYGPLDMGVVYLENDHKVWKPLDKTITACDDTALGVKNRVMNNDVSDGQVTKGGQVDPKQAARKHCVSTSTG